ncbi:prenyltransferase/squalene oxidase repeat-containing protein [Cellulomonas telluris]|uniref:prenyltransferase/squalene oxidase repeat-containing protein n=1 Tax=Cellulomonas telluris TaxID=2306636 RepID=UPI0014562F04|nr:prenyltransferase/squalene oxidase repeat-containing protein [Cellulomonas telluris]
MLAAPSADAAEAREVAADGATWLVTQLAASGVMESTFDGTSFPDYGLTADTVLALLATGDERAGEVAARLAEPDAVAGYTGDGVGTVYAGATAKLAATLSAAGIDPRSVAGRDLVAELESTQSPDGRFSDRGGEDFSQTVSQSWGVLALATARDDGAPEEAVRYLLGQQCDDGGFRLDPDAADCTSDPDATAFALSAVSAAGSEEHADVVSAATAWLRDTRETDDDGTYWVAGTPAAPSVNATAVAAAALTDVDADDPGARAWVLSSTATDQPAGAVLVAGVPDARATAQAALALAGSGLAGLLD